MTIQISCGVTLGFATFSVNTGLSDNQTYICCQPVADSCVEINVLEGFKYLKKQEGHDGPGSLT